MQMTLGLAGERELLDLERRGTGGHEHQGSFETEDYQEE